MTVTSSTLANSIDFAPRQASVLGTVHPFPSSYASVPIPGERWVSQEVARDDRKCPWYMFSQMNATACPYPYIYATGTMTYFYAQDTRYSQNGKYVILPDNLSSLQLWVLLANPKSISP